MDDVKIYTSSSLMKVAKDAFERVRASGLEERQIGQYDALVAVVFSVAAVEAFLPEFVEALGHSPFSDAPANMRDIARLAEEQRLNAVGLYSLVMFSLTGKIPSAGRQPLQDYSLLTSLRNEIIHLRSPEVVALTDAGVVESRKTILQKLYSKKVTAEHKRNDWLTLISTTATARWSVGTAKRMVEASLGALAESGAKEGIKARYEFGFLQPH